MAVWCSSAGSHRRCTEHWISACRARCARDCPTGIDMATYKSQVLDHTYRGKIRPRSHYALGWLPRWGRLITRARFLSRLVNMSAATPGCAASSVGARVLISAARSPSSPLSRRAGELRFLHKLGPRQWCGWTRFLTASLGRPLRQRFRCLPMPATHRSS